MLFCPNTTSCGESKPAFYFSSSNYLTTSLLRETTFGKICGHDELKTFLCSYCCPAQGCQGWGGGTARCRQYEGAGLGRGAWGHGSEVIFQDWKWKIINFFGMTMSWALCVLRPPKTWSRAIWGWKDILNKLFRSVTMLAKDPRSRESEKQANQNMPLQSLQTFEFDIISWLLHRWADQYTFGHKLGPLLDGTKVKRKTATKLSFYRLCLHWEFLKKSGWAKCRRSLELEAA